MPPQSLHQAGIEFADGAILQIESGRAGVPAPTELAGHLVHAEASRRVNDDLLGFLAGVS